MILNSCVNKIVTYCICRLISNSLCSQRYPWTPNLPRAVTIGIYHYTWLHLVFSLWYTSVNVISESLHCSTPLPRLWTQTQAPSSEVSMEEGCKLSRITCKDSIISSTTSRRLLFLALLQIPHTRFILSLLALHRVSQLLPSLHFCIPSSKRLYSSSLAFFAASLPLLFILHDYNNFSAVKDFIWLLYVFQSILLWIE